MIKVVSNQEQTKTGPLPIAFNSDGTPLDDYKLYGTAEGAGIIGNNLFIGIIRDCWVNFNGEIVSRENYCVLYALIEEGKAYCFSARMGTIPTPNGYFSSKPKIGDTRSAYVDLQVDEMSGYEACYFTSTETGYVAFSQMSIGDDYAVRGMVMTEGSTPAPYDYDTNDPPYGYKLPMTVESGETENSFDINRERSNVFTLDPNYYIYGGRADNKSATTKGVSITVTDEVKVQTNSGAGAGFIVPVLPNTTYTLSYELDVSVAADRSSVALNVINGEGELGTFWAIFGNENKSTFTTGGDTEYAYIVFRVINVTATFSNIMLTKGPTPPGHYIPYRYTADTPIYIGDSKLMAEEYVDYESGKVWKLRDNLFDAEQIVEDSVSTASTYIKDGWLRYNTGPSPITINVDGQVGETFQFKLWAKNFNATSQNNIRFILEYEDGTTVITGSNSFAAGTERYVQFTSNSAKALKRVISQNTSNRSAGIEISKTLIVKSDTMPETYLQPTDPPVDLPELSTYQGENTLSCSEGLGDESQITYVGPKEETIVKIMRTEDDGQGNVTEHVLYEEGS